MENGSFERETLKEEAGGARQRGLVLDRIWQVIVM